MLRFGPGEGSKGCQRKAATHVARTPEPSLGRTWRGLGSGRGSADGETKEKASQCSRESWFDDAIAEPR